MPDPSQDTIYSTSDLYFAAYLCVLEVPMIGTRDEPVAGGTQKKKVSFIFRVPPVSVGRLKADYFGGNGRVPAKQYAERIRSLKQLCFT